MDGARIQSAVVESQTVGQELAKDEARKRRVLDQLANGVLNSDDFTRLSSGVTARIADLQERLALSQSNRSGYGARISHSPTLEHLVCVTNQQYWPEI